MLFTSVVIGQSNSFGFIPGVLYKLLGGVCRWDSETLTLNQTKFSCILQPYTRLKHKNPLPISDLLFSRNLVTITVQPKQNLLSEQQQLKHVFKC